MAIWRFRLRPLLICIALVLVEVCIALFVHDRVIRPFVGDYLVLMVVYQFLRSGLPVERTRLIALPCLFCCAVEIGQYFNLVALLGLQHSRFARILIGTHFDPLDLLAYSAAALTLWCWPHRPRPQ